MTHRRTKFIKGQTVIVIKLSARGVVERVDLDLDEVDYLVRCEGDSYSSWYFESELGRAR